jgi:hypothetical protein
VLTSWEKKEAKSATYFGPEWGVPGKGYCPEAMVAISRNADFIVEDDVYVPEVYLDTQRVLEAMEEISDWLGFETTDHYQEAIAEEGNDIFKRAKKK